MKNTVYVLFKIVRHEETYYKGVFETSEKAWAFANTLEQGDGITYYILEDDVQ